jgi:uroporphyrin-3 C-methyltransferase
MMNDQTQMVQSTPANPVDGLAGKPVASHSNRLGDALSRVTLTQLTLALLAAIFVWQWLDAHYQLSHVQQEVAKRLSEVEGMNKANQTLVAQNQELVRELGGKLSLLENKYAETQNQRNALEKLYQDMSSSRDQTALAEVEQMLLIAGQQLQLSANVKAALIAMQQADSRLQSLDRPGFAGLRKSIAHDIERLRALPNIDTPAISMRLESVIEVVDKLPLAQDIRIQQPLNTAEVKPAESAWQSLLDEIWREVKHLVRIENTQKEEMPLLSPTQTFFLRENLKLRLFSARMALLSRDEVNFRRDVKTAQDWIKRYFDAKSDSGEQAIDTLKKLAASNVAINLPDVSGSLEAVRNYRAAHERGVR